MTLYRDIIKQALATTWKRKYLWFFGLFAVLLGNGGELEVVFRGLDSGDPENGPFGMVTGLWSTGLFSGQAARNIATLAHTQPLSLFAAVTVLLALLALALFLVWLTHTSLGALVQASARDRQGKSCSFRDALDKGVAKFWPVFGLNIGLKAVLAAAFLILSLPLLRNAADITSSGLIFLITFLVFVPFGIVLAFIVKYAVGFVVLRDQRVIDAFRQGWDLFARNWIVSLEMAFLLFAINLLAGIVMLFALLVVSVPFVLPAFALAKLQLVFNMWLLIVSIAAIFIAALITTGAMIATFQISAWTGLFLELTSRGGVSKLVRIYGRE